MPGPRVGTGEMVLNQAPAFVELALSRDDSNNSTLYSC